MTIPRRVARAVAVAAVPALLGVVGAAPPAAATEQTEDCEPGVTRYVDDTNLNFAGKLLGSFTSWGYATGKGVTVAVVDSGIDTGNAHLTDNVLPGQSFAGGAGDGRSDDSRHGTAVAGIIAARPLAGRSAMVGQAYDARLLPVRVFDKSVDPENPDPYDRPEFPPDAGRVAQGIRWAADHGADVINVSMTSDRSDRQGWLAQRAAVRYAQERDIVVVAASGDAVGETPVTQRLWPAAFPGVLGVAAVNGNGVVDDYSVHGPHVDVAAPGGNILVTFGADGDCIAGADGPLTSWAAGYVSGLAAQLRERHPQESAERIAYRIQASAKRPRADRRDDESGWGLIQPTPALTLSLDPNLPGPRLPGAAEPQTVQAESDFVPPRETTDPLAAPQRSLTWWVLGGAGLAALALLVRPLARRRAERAAVDRPAADRLAPRPQ